MHTGFTACLAERRWLIRFVASEREGTMGVLKWTEFITKMLYPEPMDIVPWLHKRMWFWRRRTAR